MTSRSSSDYRIDLEKQLSKVYNSKHRELLREFYSFRDFRDLFFSQPIELVDVEMQKYLNRGYNYLSSEEAEGFVDYTFDDNNINFNHETMDGVRHYVLANALAHLYASITLWLMDNTDIEDYLDQMYHLTSISKWYMQFEYRK